jgi:hypothetical protein
MPVPRHRVVVGWWRTAGPMWDYATSIHGMSHAMGASGAAQCWDCHGSHEILPVKDPASPVFK